MALDQVVGGTPRGVGEGAADGSRVCVRQWMPLLCAGGAKPMLATSLLYRSQVLATTSSTL